MGILVGMTWRWLAVLPIAAVVLNGAEWSKPADVMVDDVTCASYRARVDAAGNLVVALTLGDGWHSFAMDNQIRAIEKLAGKKALGMDKPTSFAVSGGLAVDGPWMQPELKDFSKPELRIFSWGFEKQALFAARVKRTANEPTAKVAVKGQACTEAICKNIDTIVEVDLRGVPGGAEPGLSGLSAIRTQ